MFMGIKRKVVENTWVIHNLFRSLSTRLSTLLTLQVLLYPFSNHRRCDVVEAGIVTASTRFVAEDRAGTARERDLHGVVLLLIPPHEAGIGMGGSPDSHHGGVDERGKVHVGGVHAHHDIEMAHEDQLFMQVVEIVADNGTVFIIRHQFSHLFFLFLSSEDEDAG